jgi:Flp pilus assembly protein TadG
MATEDVLLLLTVLLALVVILVLAGALIMVRRGLTRISDGLATLGGALQTVEAEHLRPLEPAVKAINAQFDVILGALPGIARKASIVAERRPR